MAFSPRSLSRVRTRASDAAADTVSYFQVNPFDREFRISLVLLPPRTITILVARVQGAAEFLYRHKRMRGNRGRLRLCGS